MDGLTYVMPLLRQIATNCAVTSVKRVASESPATRCAKAHDPEEKALIDLALGCA